MNTDTHQTPQVPQTDVKCRFFATYWGQLYEFNSKTKFRVDDGAFPLEKKGREKLILTDLKNITEEDLLFICRTKKGKIEKVELLGIEENKREKYLNIKIYFPNGWNEFYTEINEIENIDYLRSKGYALPFMGYSVEDLVSFGWVRIS